MNTPTPDAEWHGDPATQPTINDLPDDLREAKAYLDKLAAEVRCDPPSSDHTDTTPGLRFVSRPQEVEAVHWTGTAASFDEALTSLPGKVRSRGLNDLSLLAGKDGSQEWVPVPIGHWLVHMPGDLSDVWPVDPDYFASKYMPATVPAPGPDTPTWTPADPARWTVDDNARKPTLVLDAKSNDPLRFTREHMSEVTDAEFAALVALVRAHEACTHATDTLRQARALAADARSIEHDGQPVHAYAIKKALLDLLTKGVNDGG